MRLLVVEDEQSLQEDIKKKLQHSGYEVDSCGDGETASEYFFRRAAVGTAAFSL